MRNSQSPGDPAPLDIRAILRSHGLRPKRSLSQNFLVDTRALQRVAEAAEISTTDVVLEVGAGLGSLTRHLALVARRVIAVETDARLLGPLGEVLSPFQNVQVIHGDILALDPTRLVSEPGYLVVANIPYNITSALIRHMLEASSPPERLVLTVQREVAERICAGPGEMSLLALSVQVYGRPYIVAQIPAAAFYPRPKVDSSVVRVDLYPQPLVPLSSMSTFFKLVKAGFSQKRKTLRNALAGAMAWSKESTRSRLLAAGVDPRRRAETLSIEEWKALVDSLPVNEAD